MSSSVESAGFPLEELAARVNAELAGDGAVMIRHVATLEAAGEGAISFLANPRYRKALAGTRASAVIVGPAHAQLTALPKLVAANPYATYARIAAILYPERRPEPGVHSSAQVAASARVAASATVGPCVVIGERSEIGEHVVLGAGVVIGEDCTVGESTWLHAHAVLYGRTVVGKRCILHSGAVLGADGFGMAEERGTWLKVPQLGCVRLGDDVEVGANTTIDRGAIGDTIIEDDVKLDNQIQVGHNVRIGRHTAIAGCVGIAGSVVIGRNCQIAGGAMISGHLTLGDGVVVSGSTTIFDSIREPGMYTGTFPSLPHSEWRHAAAIVRRLRDLAQRVRLIERSKRPTKE